MADPENLLVVGRIAKAHGLQGEVVVKLTTNREERVAKGSVLHTKDESLVVVSSRPKDQDFLVRFEGVNSREQADALRGAELRAEPIDDPEELWVHELLHLMVVDQDGVERGVVESVEANPASDLLVLDSGALVPVRFVVNLEADRLHVDVPDGLFEL
ncbi:MAG: 16S rRNA processing protein RimM [Acidimicrobiales bacterium]|nr:16S rRNA processing protein RimM [Acidimicrobiales bacterium]RZV42033.1 MAG: 16S rRNA processing protein RimM [Acidimicrobiales bacterium]